MLNKIYIDKSSGEQVSIIKEDTNFYKLSNDISIKKEIFEKKYEIMKEIDPNSFFKQQYSSSDPLNKIAEQIKNLDINNIKDDNKSPGSHIKYNPPVVLADSSMSQDDLRRQQQEEENIKITPEQKKQMLEEWRKNQPGAQIPQIQNKNWDEEEDKFLALNSQKAPEEIKKEVKVDPIQMMFKMFKNNFPIKLNIEIEENIPNPAFIGMIQENVEADAIEYYANMISNKIIKDETKLKTEIYNQLKKIINSDSE